MAFFKGVFAFCAKGSSDKARSILFAKVALFCWTMSGLPDNLKILNNGRDVGAYKSKPSVEQDRLISGGMRMK